MDLLIKKCKQKIYLTLFSTTSVKIHQITYAIFETINHFPQHDSSVFFLAQTLHTFYKSNPLKCKFSDFPLLVRKLNKFFMSFFKQKVSFSSKFGSFFSVMRDHSSVLFQLKIYMFQTKGAYQGTNFQTAHMKIKQIPSVIFQAASQFSFKFCITFQCHDT